MPVQQISKAHIAPVVGKAGQDLQIAPGLTRDIAHPIGDPGGYAHDIVRHQILLQHRVQHPGGKNGAQRAALQYHADLHSADLLI